MGEHDETNVNNPNQQDGGEGFRNTNSTLEGVAGSMMWRHSAVLATWIAVGIAVFSLLINGAYFFGGQDTGLSTLKEEVRVLREKVEQLTNRFAESEKVIDSDGTITATAFKLANGHAELRPTKDGAELLISEKHGEQISVKCSDERATVVLRNIETAASSSPALELSHASMKMKVDNGTIKVFNVDPRNIILRDGNKFLLVQVDAETGFLRAEPIKVVP